VGSVPCSGRARDAVIPGEDVIREDEVRRGGERV